MSRNQTESRDSSSFFGQSHNKHEELTKQDIEELLLKIDKDALLVDKYLLHGLSYGFMHFHERAGPYQTGAERQKITHAFHSDSEQKKFHPTSLEAFRPIIKTASDIERRPAKEGKNKAKENECWLPVYLPQGFLFTGAIMVNRPRQGLLHTAIRHGFNWRNVIHPNLYNDLPEDALTMCNKIEGAWTDALAKIEIERFTHWFQNESARYFEILIDLQIAIYHFIQEHVTRDNYLGESCNSQGQFQMFWSIPGQSGDEEVLVTCFSTELFPPDPKLDNQHPPRPIRSIITAFFIRNRHLDEKRNSDSVLREY